MSHRISVPDEHVAIVLSRDAAHCLNALLCALSTSSRRNATSRVALTLGESDRLAIGEFVTEYGNACTEVRHDS
jgi:mRNA-degrading endonuclease toxin of MazEF toxin-antitoxin module